MPDSASMHLVAEGALDELLNCPPALLDTTLDQLRTLLMVHETGSALRAARALGREQSSVQKQIDTLNRNFQGLCGEILTVKQGRGKDALFTPTGEAVARLARGTLSMWLDEIHSSRLRMGRTLTVGTTEFTLHTISRVWERLSAEFQRRQVEFKLVHVRTKDLWSKLEAQSVDLVCGSIVTSDGDDTRLKNYEVIEFVRGRPVLLTNLPEAELPGTPVRTSRLPGLPLIVPPAGLIADLLGAWYGPAFRDRLDIAAEIDDIYYGLSLLRTGLAHGCMIVTRSLGTHEVTGGLRVVELDDDLEPSLQVMTGAFVRKTDRARYRAEHPFNLLWNAIRDETADGADPPGDR